jgi:hypothetical protein
MAPGTLKTFLDKVFCYAPQTNPKPKIEKSKNVSSLTKDFPALLQQHLSILDRPPQNRKNRKI